MSIRCPSCQSAVALEGNLSAAGRMVACQACGTRWLARPFQDNPFSRMKPFPSPPRAADISDAIVIAEEPASVRGPTRRPKFDTVVAAPPRPSRLAWIAGGVTGIGAMAVLGGVMLANALPGAPVAVAAAKLDFQKIRTETVDLRGVPTLLVEGEIVNRSGADISVPAIQVTLKTPEGQSVRTWLVEPAITGLAPGKTAGFRSALASPPAHATQVTLNLADRERSKPRVSW